jgi:hypothetical protein
MNKYIKINEDNEIIECFYEYQKNMFDGTEILLGDFPKKSSLNGKGIFDQWGYPIFIWDGNNIIEKTQNEIDSNPKFIQWYKQKKKVELNKYIGNNLLDIIKPGIRELSDIIVYWNNFKTNSSSWITKQQVDNAFDTAINWLNS